jgi:hypothetical protein
MVGATRIVRCIFTRLWNAAKTATAARCFVSFRLKAFLSRVNRRQLIRTR